MARWKPVVGFEGSYEVSDEGAVRGVRRALKFKSRRGNWHERIAESAVLRPNLINSGYHVVHLCRAGKRTPKTVHSLVAEAFFGPRPEGFDVAHWNGNRLDNRVGNLRYTTRRGNHADKRRHGTNAAGSRIAQAKLTEDQIPSIRALEDRSTMSRVARKFGVSPTTILRVWRRETWRHV